VNTLPLKAQLAAPAEKSSKSCPALFGVVVGVGVGVLVSVGMAEPVGMLVGSGLGVLVAGRELSVGLAVDVGLAPATIKLLVELQSLVPARFTERTRAKYVPAASCAEPPVSIVAASTTTEPGSNPAAVANWN